MTVGVGLQLSRSGIHAAVARVITDRGPVVHLAPICVVEDGVLRAARMRSARAKTAPVTAVADIIGEFDVDRMWFAGGQVVTPDDALAALLTEAMTLVAEPVDGLPGAVTIGCPQGWDDEARTRVDEIAARLALPLPETVPGIDAHAAAAHAALRRPIVEARPVAEPTTGSLRVLRRRAVAARPPEPGDDALEAERRRRLPGRALAVAAVVAVVGALVLLVRVRGDAGAQVDDASLGTIAPPSTPGPPVSTLPVEAPALVLGLVTDGSSEHAVRAAVGRITAAGGVLGNDVFLLAEPAGDDLAAAIGHVSTRVGAVITDVVDARLLALTAAATAADLVVCTTAPPAVGVTEEVVVVGDADRCVEFLALAAIEANDSDARRIRAAVAGPLAADGVTCASFAQCRAFAEANQPITYEPAAGRVTAARDQ